MFFGNSNPIYDDRSLEIRSVRCIFLEYDSEIIEAKMKILKLQDHIDFTLEKEEKLSSIGYKTLKNIKSPYILNSAHVFYNDADRIIYDTSNMEALSAIYDKLPDTVITAILAAFAEVLRIVEDKAFLEKEYIDLDMAHIYISMADNTAKFLILPITYSQKSTSSNEWLLMAVHMISALIENRDQLRLRELANIWEAMDKVKISSDAGSIEQNNAMIELIEAVKKLYPMSTELLTDSCSSSTFSIYVTLRYRGILGEMAFYVCTPEFYIGKNPDMEGTIGINPAISRRHMRVITVNGLSYIEDLDSSNGTYLNGIRCESGKKYQIRNNDLIRLADMDFRVEM